MSVPTRVLAGLVITIFSGFALMTSALGQDFSKRVDLDGRTAMALQRAATQFVNDNRGNIAALQSYDVRFKESPPGIFSVEFAPRETGMPPLDYDVPADPSVPAARASHRPDLSGGGQLSGDYVHALKVAYDYWKDTVFGKRFGLLATAATITQPYPGSPAASIYWVYFSPPEPKRPQLTIGCGVDRGFSVNFNGDGVTPLKPVC